MSVCTQETMWKLSIGCVILYCQNKRCLQPSVHACRAQWDCMYSRNCQKYFNFSQFMRQYKQVHPLTRRCRNCWPVALMHFHKWMHPDLQLLLFCVDHLRRSTVSILSISWWLQIYSNNVSVLRITAMPIICIWCGIKQIHMSTYYGYCSTTPG